MKGKHSAPYAGPKGVDQPETPKPPIGGNKTESFAISLDPFPAPEGLAHRATGEYTNMSMDGWAGGTASGLVCSELDPISTTLSNQDLSANLGTSLYENAEIMSIDPLISVDQPSSEPVVAPTERVGRSEDVFMDASDPLVGIVNPYVADFATGAALMFKIYYEFTSGKVKFEGAALDKYVHCLANCEAAEVGPGGVMASYVVSSGREALNIPSNVVRKDMSFAESVADSRGDFTANRIGREGALSGVRCGDVCTPSRLRGL